MDSPSSKRVAAVGRARKGRRLMAERINEEGWRLLNVANESLIDIRTTCSGRTQFRAGGTFLRILLREFITSVLEGILKTNPDAFRGEGGVSNAPISYKDVNQAFACRMIWIQGRGVAAGHTAREAFKNSLKWLEDRCTEQLNGIRMTLRVQSKVYVTCGGDQESAPQPPTSTNALIPRRSCFALMKSCFDLRDGEELFVRFLGSRLVSGLTKLLICFQQTTLSLLILLCITPQEAFDKSMQTAHIVNEWADLVLSFRQPTIICMDSYYSCKVGPKLYDKGTTLGRALMHSLGSGMKLQSCTGLRTPTQGRNSSHKLLHSVPQNRPSDYVPVYDEYKSLFSGCDKFNQQLYGKTFPYQAPNDTNLAEK